MKRALLAVFALLALLLGHIWGLVAAFGLRSKGPNRRGEGASIDILASRSIGPKQRIVLVSVAGRQLLLSVADRNARVLARWNRTPEEAEELGLSSEESTESGVGPDAALPTARPVRDSVPVRSTRETSAGNPLIAGLMTLRARRNEVGGRRSEVGGPAFAAALAKEIGQ